MVEINNQRKAFLDMLAWSEELITDVRKPEIMVMTTSLWRKLLLVSITSQTCHAKPKTQINRRRTHSFFPLVGCLPQAAWPEDFSRKVGTLWHCSRLRSVARRTLWLIVVISVRQSTVAAISGLHCRALVMVSSSIKADSLIAKFKEAGGTVREIDVWAESPRLSPLWLSASSSACHGLY